MKVFVLNIDGRPLMPTSSRKARILLREGLAVKHDYNPFTIRLTRPNGNCVQPVTLGIDPGYSHVAISVSTEKEELFSGEYEIRQDISRKISTRSEWRSARRAQLRHRKPRFDNRRKPDGWLAPSVLARISAHFNRMAKLAKILPITEIRLEVAAFDIQKIKNPDIQGIEYQQGDQCGFWNVREYVLWRDRHKCRYCGGKSKDPVLNVHHLESRKTGGDAPGNLITLCESCHKKLHRGEIELSEKRGRSFRPETFMGVMRKALSGRLKELGVPVAWTYGYVTKHIRIRLGLPKSHRIDAWCIAGNLKAKRSDDFLFGKQARRRGRQANKANKVKEGRWKANRTEWDVHGFHLFDKVQFEGKKLFIKSLRKRGNFTLQTIDGTKVKAEPSWTKLRLLERCDGWLWETRQEAANS